MRGLRELFDALDMDHSGTISIQELRVGLAQHMELGEQERGEGRGGGWGRQGSRRAQHIKLGDWGGEGGRGEAGTMGEGEGPAHGAEWLGGGWEVGGEGWVGEAGSGRERGAAVVWCG